MSKKLVIPVFKSEAEDAAWHDAHRKEIGEEFIRQVKAGTAIVVRKGEALPRPNPRKRKPTRRESPEPKIRRRA